MERGLTDNPEQPKKSKLRVILMSILHAPHLFVTVIVLTISAIIASKRIGIDGIMYFLDEEKKYATEVLDYFKSCELRELYIGYTLIGRLYALLFWPLTFYLIYLHL